MLIAVTGWLTTGAFQTTLWEVPLTAATAIWALGLGGGVGFTVEPLAFPALGIAEPFAFVVSVAPLAFAVFIGWMAWRVGNRLSDEDDPWVGAGASTVVFALASWISVIIAPSYPVRADAGGAVLVGSLLWLALLLIGLRVWEYLPWRDWAGDRAEWIADRLRSGLRLAGGLLAGVCAAASVLLLVGLVAGMGRVVGLMQALQLDAWGVIALGLVQLAYVPTLIVWSASWLLGPGVQLGTGSVAGLGGVEAAPIPVVPLFGIIPETSSPVWWALLAVPVALAAVLALGFRAEAEQQDAQPWWERLLTPALGAVIAGGTLALLAQLARGALGPGRLEAFGPQPGWVLLAATGLFFLGGAVGAFLPLEPVKVHLPFGDRERGDDDEVETGGPSRDERSRTDASAEHAEARAGDRAAARGRGDGARRGYRLGEPDGDAEASDSDADEDARREDAHPGTDAHRLPFRRLFGRIGGVRSGGDGEDAPAGSARPRRAGSEEARGRAESGEAEARGRGGEDAEAESDADERQEAPRPGGIWTTPKSRPRTDRERPAVEEPDIYADIDLDEER
ncbi:putative integral membrane protein [Gulosibacter sp. 10]|nr:putative integral membrane protein [Gulosibacter sp. 10]